MSRLAFRFCELGIAGQLLVFMFGSVGPIKISPLQYVFLPAITTGLALSNHTIYLAFILPSLVEVSRPESCRNLRHLVCVPFVSVLYQNNR